MVHRRKKKHNDSTDGGVPIMKNRSQKEDSEVSNHPERMACTPKNDHDESTEGGIVIRKNRSQKTIDYVFSFNSDTAYSKPWERFANFFFLIWESSHFIKSSSIVMLILFLANSMTW